MELLDGNKNVIGTKRLSGANVQTHNLSDFGLKVTDEIRSKNCVERDVEGTAEKTAQAVLARQGTNEWMQIGTKHHSFAKDHAVLGSKPGWGTQVVSHGFKREYFAPFQKAHILLPRRSRRAGQSFRPGGRQLWQRRVRAVGRRPGQGLLHVLEREPRKGFPRPFSPGILRGYSAPHRRPVPKAREKVRWLLRFDHEHDHRRLRESVLVDGRCVAAGRYGKCDLVLPLDRDTDDLPVRLQCVRGQRGKHGEVHWGALPWLQRQVRVVRIKKNRRRISRTTAARRTRTTTCTTFCRLQPRRVQQVSACKLEVPKKKCSGLAIEKLSPSIL